MKENFMLDIYVVITLFWIIVGVGVAYIIYLCEEINDCSHQYKGDREEYVYHRRQWYHYDD